MAPSWAQLLSLAGTLGIGSGVFSGIRWLGQYKKRQGASTVSSALAQREVAQAGFINAQSDDLRIRTFRETFDLLSKAQERSEEDLRERHELQRTLNATVEDLDRVKKHLNLIEDDLSSSKQREQLLQGRNAELEDNLRVTTGKLDLATVRITALEEHATTLQTTCDKQQITIGTLQSQIVELKTENDRLRSGR